MVEKKLGDPVRVRVRVPAPFPAPDPALALVPVPVHAPVAARARVLDGCASCFASFHVGTLGAGTGFALGAAEILLGRIELWDCCEAPAEVRCEVDSVPDVGEVAQGIL